VTPKTAATYLIDAASVSIWRPLVVTAARALPAAKVLASRFPSSTSAARALGWPLTAESPAFVLPSGPLPRSRCPPKSAGQVSNVVRRHPCGKCRLLRLGNCLRDCVLDELTTALPPWGFILITAPLKYL
jgi:hypothetical protein